MTAQSAPVNLGRPQRRTSEGLQVSRQETSATDLPRPEHPWHGRDLANAWLFNLVGLGLLLGGLQGTRHTTDPEQLVVWMNVAAVGLVLALGGNAVFLLSGLRQVGRLRTALLVRPDTDTTQLLPPVAAPARAAAALVATPAMTRFHLASCPAAAGKPVSAAPLAEHIGAGRRPCGMCRPDQLSEAGT